MDSNNLRKSLSSLKARQTQNPYLNMQNQQTTDCYLQGDQVYTHIIRPEPRRALPEASTYTQGSQNETSIYKHNPKSTKKSHVKIVIKNTEISKQNIKIKDANSKV